MYKLPEGKQQKEKIQVDNSTNKRIFISNIPLEATVAEVKEICDGFGRVLSLQIRKGKKTASSTVLFMTHEDAEFALYRIQSMNWKLVISY
jgi:RNA recognition motif-containing protein